MSLDPSSFDLSVFATIRKISQILMDNPGDTSLSVQFEHLFVGGDMAIYDRNDIPYNVDVARRAYGIASDLDDRLVRVQKLANILLNLDFRSIVGTNDEAMIEIRKTPLYQFFYKNLI